MTAMTKAKTTAKTPARKGTSKPYRRRRGGGKRPWRRPVAGLLEPGQTIVHTLDPPLAVNEQPIALTPNAGDIMLIDPALDRVTIQNQTDRVVAYMVTVVPSLVVKAAMVPWRRVATDLGHAVRESGLLDQFKRLLR